MSKFVKIAAGLALSVTAVAHADFVAYDQYTAVQNTTWLIPSSAVTAPAPAGSGNRQMGSIVNLAGTDNQISGFDLAIVNATGAAIANNPGTLARLNFWVWNTSTQGASTSTLAFSNLAGAGTVDFNLGALTAPFANNTLLFISTGAAGAAGFPPLAGVTPGAPAFAPITVTSLTGIGIVYRWDLSTDNGQTWTQPNGLTSLITGGATAPAPTVGTNGMLASPTFGYYRSPQSTTTDINGNFAQGSARQVGNNSGVVQRVFTVPAPASMALLGLGGLVAGRRRRA